MKCSELFKFCNKYFLSHTGKIEYKMKRATSKLELFITRIQLIKYAQNLNEYLNIRLKKKNNYKEILF